MATQIPNFYTINGVIDTSKSVLENMNLLAEASGCWMSYDINEGKWAVIINNTGSSVASFNDSNILGSVNITSPGLTEVYNTVEMQFPHKDLIDEPDYVTMSVTAGNRYPNEPDNVLSINSQLINNQAQAQSIAGRQLKQSRIDKIINFQADYSYIGLKAGDLISVTNSVYSWTNKVFRIISIQEQSADDGNIIMDITALEYDAGVYSTADLQITPRNTQNGITASYLNSSIVNNNNLSTAKSLSGYGFPIYDCNLLDYKQADIQAMYTAWIAANTPDYYNTIRSSNNLGGIINSIFALFPVLPDTNNIADHKLDTDTVQVDFGPYVWSIHVEIPHAILTYNSNAISTHMPFYVAIFYAPFNSATDKSTPTNDKFELIRLSRATTKNQNVDFYFQNAPNGIYRPLLIPAPDIGSNYTNVNPTAISDVFGDGDICASTTAYIFLSF